MTPIEVLVCAALILTSGFLSSSEIALFSLSRFQVRFLKDRIQPSTHRKIKRLLQDPGGLLVSILVLNEVVNTWLASLITHSVARQSDALPGSDAPGDWASHLFTGTLITTLLMLFACEITPKVIGARASPLIATLSSGPLSLVFDLMKPVRSALTWVISLFSGASSRSGGKRLGGPKLKESEFLLMVEEGHKEGAIQQNELELIQNVFELDDTRVEEILTPLSQVATLVGDTQIRNALSTIRGNHFSRIPITTANRRQIVGILYAKDLLRAKLEQERGVAAAPGGSDIMSQPISSLMRKPLMAQPSMQLNALFRKFKQQRTHMAVVQRPSGEALGIVTMDDVLESLFGDLLDPEERVILALVPPLLLCEGFFSGSEIALLSADKVALKQRAKDGSARARLALALATHPERIFSTTLLMTSLCVACISGIAALYFMNRLGEQHAEWMTVLTASPLIVIFGELIPKTVFQRYSDRIALWIAPIVYAAYFAFFPITRVLSIYTTRLSRLVGPVEELVTGHKATTREELRSLMSIGRRESEISTAEKRMIRRILDFKDSEAKHALIPLVQVEVIEDSATIREALERFERHRHSRMPVFADRVDNIVGALEASDLFAATDLNQPIRNYMSSAHYVAETQSLEDLLREMSHEDNEMVVVVDEHGGAVGILTFEDIVEEIVGEIADEYDQESSPYKELEEGRWLVQARMEIDRINEKLKIDLPPGEYETLSGFLLQQFGRIPEPRDELFFHTSAGQLKLTIKQATERHIESVLIERIS